MGERNVRKVRVFPTAILYEEMKDKEKGHTSETWIAVLKNSDIQVATEAMMVGICPTPRQYEPRLVSRAYIRDYCKEVNAQWVETNAPELLDTLVAFNWPYRIEIQAKAEYVRHEAEAEVD